MTVVDDYIATYDGEARAKLEAMRDLIRTLVPEASEKIAYGLATWDLNGNLVHIGGFSRHVGLYPGAAGVAEFADELGPWTHSKGAIQFPLDQPLPTDLITRIVTFRATQQRAKPAKRRR